MIGWWISVVLFGLALSFDTWRTWQVRRHARTAPPPPINLLMWSGFLVLSSIVGSMITPATFGLQVTRILALALGLALSYAGNVWLVTGQPYHVGHSRWTWALAIIVVCATICGYLSRDT